MRHKGGQRSMNREIRNINKRLSFVENDIQTKQELFISYVIEYSNNLEQLSRTKLEKKGIELGINDPREIKELTETALVAINRSIAQQLGLSIKGRYEKMVEIYKAQPNLSLRTSTSILLQQYSTPAPLAYLLGIYCKLHEGVTAFEPSAGNGIMTIASASKKDVYVNEIDELRRTNLEKQGFAKVFNTDASKDFKTGNYRSFFDNIEFDAVITNPPFASLNPDEYRTFGGYEIRNLDHLMTIYALGTMKDSGRAGIIVGGHTEWDDYGRIKAGKNLKFLSYLYKNYNVDDVININGDLYSRMGTSFDIRMILINGRKDIPSGQAPNKSQINSEKVNTFEQLFERISNIYNEKSNKKELILQSQAQRIRILLLKNKLK